MEGSKRKHMALVLAAAVGLSMGTARAAEQGDPTAPASEPGTQQMLQQMKEMQAKIEKLEAKEHQQEARIEGQAKQQAEIEKRQVDATVDAVQRSARHDSQLLDIEGFTAGYSKGKFVIAANDGSFSFHPWLHLQFREIVNHRQDAKSNGDDDTEYGTELRRARFGFDGNLFSPDFTYFFNWATYRSNSSSTVKIGSGSGSALVSIGGLPVLEECWIKYKLPNSDFYVKAGQLHDPLAHEAIVGSKYEITPERSVQNDIFSNTDTFTQGATVIYDPHKDFRFEGGANDGIRGANTNFQSPPANGNVYNFGVAARGEYKVMGNWKDYDQITAYGDKSDLLVFGTGADYSEAGKDAQLTHTLDMQYGSPSGAFLYASYIGRYTRHNLGIPNGGPVSSSLGTPGVSGKDTYEPSILLQADYCIDQHWEPYVRYEYMHLAGTPAGSHNDVQEISGGVGYWFHGHNAKLTSQVMYLPKGIPISDTSSDILSNNGHGELIFTTQFQLLF